MPIGVLINANTLPNTPIGLLHKKIRTKIPVSRDFPTFLIRFENNFPEL